MTQVHLFTEREREVVHHLLQGKSNKMIAQSLCISERTVEFHLKNIYAKCQVRSRTALILKLGISTGAPATAHPGSSTGENLGSSTVAHQGENAEAEDEGNPQRDWPTSFRAAAPASDREATMHRHRTFYISSGLLWAATIIASALVGAPTVLSVILLPALSAAFFLVTGSLLSPSESGG
jgi:DNA-binding CsgD family transcriptional regulator